MTYPPPAPPAKKSRKGLWISLGVLAVLFVGCTAAIAGGSSGTPPTAPAQPAGSVGSSIPEVAPAPAPEGSLSTFGNGDYEVGTDVEPGTYRSPGVQNSIAPLCYWDLKDPNGVIQDQGLTPEGPSRATLREGLLFSSQGCEDWVKA